MPESIVTLSSPSAKDLDKKVLIRKRSDFPMGDSALDSQFTDPVWRWARIQPVGTAIYAEGRQTDHNITHRIWIRHLDGVTSGHEVVHGAHLYRVLRGAPLDGDNRFTLLEVEQLQ